MGDIVRLKKIKYLGPVNENDMVFDVELVPVECNKKWVKRTITFYPDEIAMVTEDEFYYLMNEQKEHRFVEIIED